ncbi:MAG: M56 family metallopeptidase [Armatimonadetes bacterium]|nr:M56 family metallopeptidase [Armatimonadota bacterium]
MTALADWLAYILWQSSLESGVFALVVWVLSGCLPRLPALTRVWLWRAVALRFVLGPALVVVAGHRAQPAGSLSWLVVVLTSMTAVVGLTRLMFDARLMRQRLTATTLCDVWDTVRSARNVGLPQGVQVRWTSAHESPYIAGWREPVLVLPRGASRELVTMAAAHEAAHLKHGDLAWNALAAAVESMFLFHPLAWVMRHELSLAQETACDAAAMQATGVRPQQYCEMLVAFALGRTPCWTETALQGTAATLKRRIKHAYFAKGPGRQHSWALVLAFGVAVMPVTRPADTTKLTLGNRSGGGRFNRVIQVSSPVQVAIPTSNRTTP